MTKAITDVVVLIPGITGSRLVRRQGDTVTPIWAPSPGVVARAVRIFGRSLTALRLAEIPDDGPADDGIEAVGLIPYIHVIPGVWSVELGYSKIASWLDRTFHLFEYDHTAPANEQQPVPNFVKFAYDWRLSNRHNAQVLKETVEPVLSAWQAQGEPFRKARLVLVCHSMGGLLARWYAEQLGGAEHVRAIVTIGTPHRGSAKALHSIVNGAPKALGPIARRLTEALRTFPSMYELLPAYQCISVDDRLLTPHEATIPHTDADRARRARESFHDVLHARPTRESSGYDLHTIVGIRQPTRASAVWADGRLTFSELIDGDDLGGDGTVARLAATPPGPPLNAPDDIDVFSPSRCMIASNFPVDGLYSTFRTL